MRVKVSDGKSVKVIASKDYKDGDFASESGFNGFVIGDSMKNDTVVINIEQAEYEGSTNATVKVGDILAFDASKSTQEEQFVKANGTLPNVLRVTEAPDANKVFWGILLPQSFTPATTTPGGE